jgi:5-methylcytosine-specific restriction endonuclease McrBC GTP-binding regulatory subunit McrB
MKFNYDKEQRMVDLKWDYQNIYDYFDSRGFFFSKEVLTRYVLSLKTKPFIILTGISGTGKTKIAQIFADYVCQADKKEEQEKRVAFVPVRPDWMDNKGLLGYYNLLDEKYHATAVLKLLLESC